MHSLTALRLAAQHIAPAAEPYDGPADVVRGMLGMQAQDLPGARWSVGLRSPGSTEAQVEAALANGTIVRSWPMRGTLHLTAPEDVGWMLAIAEARQRTTAAKRRADLEITDQQLSRAGSIAESLMVGGTAVRRDSLLAAWEAAGIPTTGQRAYHLIWNLGHARLIVFGPPDGKQPTFVLLDEWVASPRHLAGDEALAEFALRYFSGHGPATVRDLAWWASITLGDARRGLAAVADRLERREIDGNEYWMRAGLTPAAPGVHALPGFDEYLLGYQDRSAALPAEFAGRIVPGNNGIFLPTIVSGGRVVGTWKRTDAAAAVSVVPTEFAPLTKAARVGFDRAIGRYGAFVNRPVRVTR